MAIVPIKGAILAARHARLLTTLTPVLHAALDITNRRVLGQSVIRALRGSLGAGSARCHPPVRSCASRWATALATTPAEASTGAGSPRGPSRGSPSLWSLSWGASWASSAGGSSAGGRRDLGSECCTMCDRR
eukprot:XP_001709620.1 Hypothetical protein GL50803_18725 [Giardia lamblia ATCC 50803]